MKTILNLKTGSSYPYITYIHHKDERSPTGLGEAGEVKRSFWILKTESAIPYGTGESTYEIEGGEKVIFDVLREIGEKEYLTERTT